MTKILALVATLLFTTQIFAQRDYNTLHDLLIKFYGYQRAGLKSGSCYNLNSNFQNASHGGDSYSGHPLDGGWYDAGDYIKFGMNLSYSVYCLLKGYDVFPAMYADKYKWDHTSGTDNIPDILNQVKFATDYINKAVIDNNTVILDVGNGASEHSTWGVVNGSGRTGTLCDGGDIPATYAACLALMATCYRKFDAAYADTCLNHAKMAFTFAKNKFSQNKTYCTPQGSFYDYPTVDGAKVKQVTDRMIAAGVELYRATNNGDPIYISWAQQSATDFYNCIGYAYIGPLASFEVWRQDLGGAGAASLISNLNFIENHISEKSAFANIYQNSDWGTARDAGSAAFEYALGYITSSNEDARTKYKKRVADHVDWVGGYNGGQSYICGINKGPSQTHYRTTNYGAVPGAVVSGPKGDGSWEDKGAKYDFTEVAVDYNAGIIGAVAFLKAINSTAAINVSTQFSAKPNMDVDLSANPVVLSATFSKTVTWTISIIGNLGSKTYTGSGTAISASWDGSADKGCFLAGEIVKARLSVEGDISVLDLQKTRPISIIIAKTKKNPTKAEDVLVDNFEKSDTLNKIGGFWKAIGTGTGLKTTSSAFSTQDGSMAMQLNGNVSSWGNTTYSSIKTTFDSAGKPTLLGPVKSVVFDLKASIAVSVSVELEQSTITDGAYYSKTIPVSTLTNNYRLAIADFTQPDWAVAAVPLDLSKITSLRFTVYDSTGIIKLYLDNLYIEGLKIGADIVASRGQSNFGVSKPSIARGTLVYDIPHNIFGTVQLSILNVAGKTVMKRGIDTRSGKTGSMAIPALPAGMYFVKMNASGIDGKPFGQPAVITIIK